GLHVEACGAGAGVGEGGFGGGANTAGGGRTPLKTLVVVNGEPTSVLCGVDIKKANEWLASFADRMACADTHRNDMAFWMCSSGSNGRPQGILPPQPYLPYPHHSSPLA